jgi:hypothetical protein
VSAEKWVRDRVQFLRSIPMVTVRLFNQKLIFPYNAPPAKKAWMVMLMKRSDR